MSSGSPHCCICESTVEVAWCWLCGHYFCERHRTMLSGWIERTKQALGELFRVMPPPPYCDHRRE